MHLRHRVHLAVATALALVALVGTANAQNTQGTLTLRIVGLSGVAGDVVIRATSGDVVATLTFDASLTLPAGRYTVSARASGAYQAILPTQTVDLPAGGERDLEVRYEMSPSGSAERTQLLVTVTGLPDGTAADLRLHGAHGVDETYTDTFIRYLYAGQYTVTARPVGDHVPAEVTQEVLAAPDSMDPGSYGVVVDVVYGPASEVEEPPPGTSEEAASGIRLTVHGPQGPGTGNVSIISVDGTGHGGNFTDDADVPLPPGTYLVLGSTVGVLTSDPYRQTVEVDEDAWVDVEVRYPRADGRLRVRTAGLPERMGLYLDIEGPQGAVFSDNAGQDLTLHLPEGRYVVTPRDVPGYLPREAQAQAVVPADGTVTVDLVFEPEGDRDTTTRIALRATGVPGDTGVTVSTTAEDGSALTVHGVTSAPVTFTVPAGLHVVDPQGLAGFEATVIPAEVRAEAGETTEVEVRYEKEGLAPDDAGALDVLLTGLPDDVDGDVRVTGPGDVDVTVTASDRLLVPAGVYLVTASPAAGYVPEPGDQVVKVVPLDIVPVEVRYGPSLGGAAPDPSHQCTPYAPTPAGRAVAETWSEPNERDDVGFSVPGDPGGGWVETKLTTDAPSKPWAVTTVAGDDPGAIGSGGTDGQRRIDVFEVAPGQGYASEVRAFVNAPVDQHPWPWTWSWTFHSRVDCYEPNDTIADAKAIPLDTSVEAYLIAGHVTNGIAGNDPRTYDWYRFELEEETAVTLHVLQIPSNTRWSSRLMTAEGRQVGGAIRAPRGETVSGDLGTLSAGTWYLEIHPSPDLRHAVPSSGHAVPEHFNVPYVFELEAVEP